MLIIDTSQKIGVVALKKEEFGIIKKEFDASSQQKVLLPCIIELLAEAQISLKEIDEIRVCIGPGSFTGTRIGVMTAKTLAYANNTPLSHFNSLLPYYQKGFLTILDAKNGECFCFDGVEIKKITYNEIQKLSFQLNSPITDKIPLGVDQAVYNIQNIIKYKYSLSCSIIYY